MCEEDQSSASSAPNDEAQPTEQIDETAGLKEELGEALREKDQFRAMAQRAQADLINYKRRAAEEMLELRQASNSKVLLKVLAVVDDLDRAISLIPQDAVAPGWLDGLLLVLRNVNSILDSEGVTKIEAAGRPFEPWEFEAVQYVETPDAEEGIVINVVQDGYKLHDKVLRAARVIVAKKPEPQLEPETTDEETQ